jgi:hypothetical protein
MTKVMTTFAAPAPPLRSASVVLQNPRLPTAPPKVTPPLRFLDWTVVAEGKQEPCAAGRGGIPLVEPPPQTLDDCLTRRLCTKSAGRGVKQPFFECATCPPARRQVCVVCGGGGCHAGHELKEVEAARFTCDCAEGGGGCIAAYAHADDDLAQWVGALLSSYKIV